MLTLPTSLRVFAHRFATDMRKSFEGLCGIIEAQLGQTVESGHLFLFFNRRRDRVKVMYFAGDGIVILYKKLEAGTFETPRGWRDEPEKNNNLSSASHGIEMRASDLALILEGIDLSSVKRRKRWRREVARV
jgi:transposase